MSGYCQKASLLQAPVYISHEHALRHFLYPCKTNILGVNWNQPAYMSICLPSLHLSIYVQNIGNGML